VSKDSIMATHLHHDGCTSDSADCSIPSEFVRLRYYFGQRLGVVDLFDEQHYHAGKQRFHNLRTHGAGVLCGLTAERFEMPGTNTATTVLRVKRGAALDPCGREIIVNVDQCIDVAAWFQKHRPKLDWTAGDHTLTVALCYRECPSDPGPAPRDPCGCDTGGCEFGRVRESFELKLLTEDEAEHCFDETFPTRAALAEALGAQDLGAALDAAVAAPCPAPAPDACLCLAAFTVTVGDQPLRVTAMGEPAHDIAARASLLSTAALQELVLQIAGEVNGGSGLGVGPALGAATYSVEGSDHVLEVPVRLAPGAGGSAAIELAQDTFDPTYVELRRFHQHKWQTPEQVQATYETTGGAPRIRVLWPGTPDAGNYRLTIAPPIETPIVDRHMRALRPSLFAFQFSLTGDPLVFGPPTF
jgi:hypothetical protein